MRFGWMVLLVLGASVGASSAAAQKVIVTERLEDLETRARTDSNDAAAHYNVAMGYLSKKRYADAERALQLAVKIEPQFADAFLALSMVRNWDDEHWKQLRKAGGDSAATAFEEANNKAYRRAFLIDPLVDIKILGGTYRFYGSSRYVKALEDLVEGRYEKAYEKFGGAIKFYQGSQPLDSVSANLLWLRSLAAARTNRSDAAIADLQHLLDRETRGVKQDSLNRVPLAGNEYRYVIAALHQREGRADEATRLYEEVLANDLGNYMAHVQLARLHEAAGRWEAAATERRRAVETSPEDPSLLLDLGVTLGKAGRFDEAAETLQQAGQANPRDSRAFYWLGVVELKRTQRDAAREAFSRFVTLAPSRYAAQRTQAEQRLAELR